jgi:hypothetical protein
MDNEPSVNKFHCEIYTYMECKVLNHLHTQHWFWHETTDSRKTKESMKEHNLNHHFFTSCSIKIHWFFEVYGTKGFNQCEKVLLFFF